MTRTTGTIDTYIHLLPDDLVPATFFDELTATAAADAEPVVLAAAKTDGEPRRQR